MHNNLPNVGKNLEAQNIFTAGGKAKWYNHFERQFISKGNQSWIFIRRTDVEAETPILWSPDAKGWFIVKDPDAGRDWRQEENGTTKVEMVGWHHWLDEHEFEQASEVGDGQGSLVCCSPWGRKELDTTEQQTELNWTEQIWIYPFHTIEQACSLELIQRN